MKLLDKEQIQAGERFIVDHGRPLEQALYRFYFDSGAMDDVIAELAKYQNPDGGFGHALESDFRLPASSTLATTEALQCLIEMGCPLDHDLFTSAITYLVNEFDAEHVGWWITPPEVLEYPHAPWWGNDQDKLVACIGDWINPCAEIVGYLHARPDLVPQQVLTDVTEKLIEQLELSDERIEGHNFLCYARTLPFLPESERTAVYNKLCHCLESGIEMDKAKWSGYSIAPHCLVRNEASPFYSLVSPVFGDNLDWIIDTQHEDGSWHPNWTWGQFENEWQNAKREWQGVLTLRNLMLLKNFNRLAT